MSTIIHRFFSTFKFDEPRQSESARLPFTTDRTQRCAENRASSIMHARMERNRAVQAYRPVAGRSALHTKLPDHRGCVQPSQAFPHSCVSNVVAPTYNVTWEFSAYLLGQRVGKGTACTKKLNHSSDHRRRAEEMRHSLRKTFARAFVRTVRHEAAFKRRRNGARQKHVKGW